MVDHPPAKKLCREEHNIYENAWDCLCQPTPHALFELARQGTGLPALDPALKAFVQRYPDKSSGLGSIATRVLQAITTEKRSTAHIVGEAMAINDSNIGFTGDSILFDTLCSLAPLSLEKPLVEIWGDSKEMRNTKARITTFGQACLSGEANRIKTNGIDEHIAGVHLSSDSGRIWYREDEFLA